MQNQLEDPISEERAEVDTGEETKEAFPSKPSPEDVAKGNQTLRFLISVVLFVAFYYFFVSKDLQVITWLAIIVLIHELGHYFAMKFFNYQDLSIFFIPLVGAIAGGSKEKISQKEKAIVLLAGPVPGIIIGIVLYFVARHLYNYSLVRLSYAFVLINILNLLPIYPLDGGQLLKTLFLGSRQIITSIFMIASIALLIIYSVVTSEWMLLIIPYFLIIRMVQAQKISRIRKSLEQQEINYSKGFGDLTDEEYWKIRDVVITENPVLGRTIIAGEHIVSQKENEVINYIKTVLRIKPVKDLSITGIVLFILVWVTAMAAPVALSFKLIADR